MVSKYDSNMRPNEIHENGIRWMSPKSEPFRVSGLAWFAEEGKYRRLPTFPAGVIPEAVDVLADHPAGGQIRFQTDSSSLSVRVKLKGKADMVHMPATGQCGVDCYTGPAGEPARKFVNTTRYDLALSEYECMLFSGWERKMRSFTLFLPLYQGVEEIWVGLDEQASVIAPPDYRSARKVVIYGTSITQGGCASRPGMAYPNILSRRIPVEFINLGFSGSGKGEPEVARVIAQIADPALFVLDYEANAGSAEQLSRTLPEFIRILRAAHPEVPILVVSKIRYAREAEEPGLLRNREECKRVQQEHVRRLREQGDRNVYFFDGSRLLGREDVEECTVDGVHPTDLGFLRMADGLESVIATLLS